MWYGRAGRRTLSCIVGKTSDDSAFSAADFDRYVDEHGIPEEDWPAAFALWLAERTGGPVRRFQKVEWEAPEDGS